MGIMPRGLGSLTMFDLAGTVKKPFASAVDPDRWLFRLVVRTSFLEFLRFVAGAGLSEPEVVSSSESTATATSGFADLVLGMRLVETLTVNRGFARELQDCTE
jgi:hypothetical protein